MGILHAAEITLYCSSLHLVPIGQISILVFDCRNVMNKLVLHLIKCATFVINYHRDALFVTAIVILQRRGNTKRVQKGKNNPYAVFILL